MQIALCAHSADQLKFVELLFSDPSLAAASATLAEGSPAERVFFEVVKDLTNILAKRTDLPLGRVYFGCETCERRIPTPAVLAAVLDVTQRYGAAFTLVTPYVSDWGLRRLARLVDLLDSRADDIEVVVNDLGVLHFLGGRSNKLRLVLGRLLSKIVPLLRVPKEQIASLEESMFAYVRSNAISSPYFRELLRRYDVRRIEFSAYPQGLAMPLSTFGFAGSLHFPWIYVSSTRICEFGSFSEPIERKFKVDSGCRRECKNTYLVLSRPGAHRKAYFAFGRALAAVCEQRLDRVVSGLNDGIDRLVVDPFLPE